MLGDAHGTACAAHATRFVEQAFNRFGYSVRRNDPYAGGYITRHYGRPRERVHALQIEISRHLYMDETRLTKSPGFARVRAHAGDLINALGPDCPRPAGRRALACAHEKNGGTVRCRQV